MIHMIIAFMNMNGTLDDLLRMVINLGGTRTAHSPALSRSLSRRRDNDSFLFIFILGAISFKYFDHPALAAIGAIAFLLTMLVGSVSYQCPRCRQNIGHVGFYVGAKFRGSYGEVKYCPCCGVSMDEQVNPKSSTDTQEEATMA